MKFAMLPYQWEQAAATLTAAGHTQVTDLAEADFLFFNGSGTQFPHLPANIQYVQAASAGMDGYRTAGVLSDQVRWANASGLYRDSVAEGTLGLMLGAAHLIKLVTARSSWSVARQMTIETQFLYEDKTVAIIGAGGIGRRLIELLEPFGCQVIAVNHSGRPVPGAAETHPIADVDKAQVWQRADFVVLLAPLTEETHHFVNASVLATMKPSAFLINAGRGPLINTDDLVAALENGEIAGAALDVTEPEPLPDGHPLWALDNCLITPHTTNTTPIMKKLIGPLAVANAAAFEAGERMPNEVDVAAGY